MERKNIMLGTAGHVDHGKTALVKVLTGCDTDTLAEEKQRGLTIDLGFAPCRMADERIVGIVDVPGHVDFIRNMVAGAQGIDVVILVVAADDSVMPQTREHLDILTLMGVRRGLVAMTKIDLIDETMRELVADDIRTLLRGTFLQDAPICGVSNITGEGFDAFLTTLNEIVDACPPRSSGGLFRMWVEDVFTIRGFGTVVTGIPAAGEVRLADRLRILPGDQVARVRKMQVYGEDAPLGRAGECVAINLADADTDALGRGQVLCAGEGFEPVTMAEAELRLLDSVTQPLKDYAEVHFHVGTAEVMANVAMLDRKAMAGGERALVQLRLSSPLGLAAGERFVLRTNVGRAGGGHLTTVGGGRIVGTSNLRLRRGRPWTIEALEARSAALDSPRAWCELNLKEAAAPLNAPALTKRAQLLAGQVEAILAELRKDGAAVDAAGGEVVHRDVVAAAAGKLAEALDQFHAANPLRAGAEEAELFARSETPRNLFDLAVAELIAKKSAERSGTVLSLRGRGAKLSAQDRALCEQIEKRLREAGLAVPLPSELAAALAVPEPRLNNLVRLLVDQGSLLRLDEKVVMHRETVEAAKKVVLSLFAKAGSFETVEFRDALGVSRKYAVPLLDYFDTIRLTVRSGSRRTPGSAAKNNSI